MEPGKCVLAALVALTPINVVVPLGLPQASLPLPAASAQPLVQIGETGLLELYRIETEFVAVPCENGKTGLDTVEERILP